MLPRGRAPIVSSVGGNLNLNLESVWLQVKTLGEK